MSDARPNASRRAANSTASVQLRLFGSFELRDNGAGCALTCKKARALLTFLALHPGQSHPRGRLASMFWADSTERAGRHSLRQNLASLRRTLGSDFLASDRDTVALAGNALRVDALEFEALVEQQTPRALERACAIYRGDLLDGFASRAAAFDDWLAAERARLHERALDTMDELLARYLEGGDTDLAIPLANRVLALDPVREPAHRALMKLLSCRGRHTEAIRQYRRCVSVLERELGLAPDAATEALHERIVASREQTSIKPASVPPAPPRPPSTRQSDIAPVSAEVRHVVIVQIQLVDFSRVMQSTSPELAHALLTEFYRVTDDVVTSFAGHTLSRMGENVRAIFGLPKAQTNDAERAMHCAQALHETIAGLDCDGVAPRARVAIAAGNVLASKAADAAGFTVTGEILAECDALLAATMQGHTAITKAARDKLPETLTVRRSGMTTPGDRQIAALDMQGKRATPFVGRTHERHLMRAACRQCLATRHGKVFLVRGEAGIGKSRLLHEWRASAQSAGFEFVLSRAVDFGVAINRDTVSTLVRGLLSLPADATNEACYAAVRSVRERDVVAKHDQMFLLDLLGLPLSAAAKEHYAGMENATRQQGRGRTIARLLEARAQTMPVMLAVEDIHWANAATLGVLAQLAKTVSILPVLLVLTARTGEDPDEPGWLEALGDIPHAPVDLPRLQRSEARELALALSDEEARDLDAVVARAAGNPLFLEQLLQTAQTDADTVPDSVQTLASVRLDRLSGPDRLAAQAASALGERFSLQVLRHLLDEPMYDPAALVAERLVRASDAEYRFDHALVRDGVYATLLASQRQVLHRRAARWYALRDSLLHAEQLERAGDANAGQAYRAAASEQAAAFHYELALQLADRARRLTTDPVAIGEIEAQRGEFLRALADVEGSIVAFESALSRALTPAARCTALLGIASGLRIVNRPEPALSLLTEAQTLAESIGDNESLARIHHLRGNLLFPLQEVDKCEQAHKFALKFAREAGSVELEILAQCGLGDAAFRCGRVFTAYGCFDRCVRLCRRHGVRGLEASVFAMRGHAAIFKGDNHQAEADFDAADESATLVGNLRDRWCAQLGLGIVDQNRDELAAAMTHYETATELARTLQAPPLAVLALGHQAWVLALGGDHEGAEALITPAVEECRTTCIQFAGTWLLGALAWITRDPARRAAAISEAEGLLRGLLNNDLAFHWFAMERCLELGEWDDAERRAARLAALTSDEPIPMVVAMIKRVGLIARHGRGERSATLAAEAQGLMEEIRVDGYLRADDMLQGVATSA